MTNNSHLWVCILGSSDRKIYCEIYCFLVLYIVLIGMQDRLHETTKRRVFWTLNISANPSIAVNKGNNYPKWDGCCLFHVVTRLRRKKAERRLKENRVSVGGSVKYFSQNGLQGLV